MTGRVSASAVGGRFQCRPQWHRRLDRTMIRSPRLPGAALACRGQSRPDHPGAHRHRTISSGRPVPHPSFRRRPESRVGKAEARMERSTTLATPPPRDSGFRRNDEQGIARATPGITTILWGGWPIPAAPSLCRAATRSRPTGRYSAEGVPNRSGPPKKSDSALFSRRKFFSSAETALLAPRAAPAASLSTRLGSYPTV